MDRHRQYRKSLAVLRLLALRDYVSVWKLLDTERLDETFPGFAVAVTGLLTRHRETAAALARQYIALARADAGVAGPAPVVPTPTIPAAQIATSLGVTTVTSVKHAMTRGTPLAQASANAFKASSGAFTRLIENASRDTVRAAVDADPAVRGWTRETSGSPCEWCAGLADGSVLPGSVEMAAHDHCSCSAAAVFGA